MINILEAVGKTGNPPSSERKILTRETHQGCLSFAITGFSELLSSEKPHAACQKSFYNYDEEYDEYICDVDLDEDEMVRFLSGRGDCPYWRPGDEYRTARRQ